MPNPELEEFAKIIIEHVRDAAVQSADSNLRPEVRHVIAKRWKEAGRSGDLEGIAQALIPDIVDDTVSHLLRAIDQGLLQLSFKAANGKTIDLYEDGQSELVGWYMGSEGWRSKYSRQRFIDDFSDLR